MNPRDILQKLGLGKVYYQLGYRPYSKIRDYFLEGGSVGRYQVRKGRAAMQAAATRLSVPGGSEDLPPLEPHLLTGKRFWDQTVFCLWSFAHQSGRRVAPHIYDDGTLDGALCEQIQRIFPRTHFVSQKETLRKLDKLLPVERFPYLRERWVNYPNIRKLIDVHLGSEGWKLVLDSDMLFFKRPQLLTTWMDAPDRPLHGIDCMESYGYSRPLMESLTGHVLAPMVNVGICGLNSSEIDWEKLESWTATLIQKEKTNYYLEQALVAMLVAGRDCVVAPQKEYLTLPSKAECLQPTVVMQHYVFTAKRWYFSSCWRTSLTRERH